jgi:hypothetical protein
MRSHQRNAMVTGSGQSDTAATGFVVRVITAAGWNASTAGVRAGEFDGTHTGN